MSSTSYNNKLGRWKINDNIQRKIDLANIDNCGDRLCGIPISNELIDKINKQNVIGKPIFYQNKKNYILAKPLNIYHRIY